MSKVLIEYKGQELYVTKEVAAFLEKSRKQIAASDRKYRSHNVPLVYENSDAILDTRHCAGRNYLLNVVIRNERIAATREALNKLPANMERLYRLRYGRALTQQQIADKEGVSKMAICKRLKNLHALVKKELPNWPERDFMVGP
ncbi:MAG: sigma factor-like helix-turn-helix DNA-binding protein [Clostridiaceae bacterium]